MAEKPEIARNPEVTIVPDPGKRFRKFVPATDAMKGVCQYTILRAAVVSLAPKYLYLTEGSVTCTVVTEGISVLSSAS